MRKEKSPRQIYLQNLRTLLCATEWATVSRTYLRVTLSLLLFTNLAIALKQELFFMPSLQSGGQARSQPRGCPQQKSQILLQECKGHYYALPCLELVISRATAGSRPESSPDKSSALTLHRNCLKVSVHLETDCPFFLLGSDWCSGCLDERCC